ncbi:MAG: hypothetical protein EBU52_14420, partial [Cytophagia bacterium]|nr:hypothetical protein [Cytophagia bacterium]
MKLSKYNYSLLLSACIFFIACQPDPKDYTDKQVIFGLASVITLTHDTSYVNLEDYVLEPAIIDSISVPPTLQAMRKDNMLLLVGALPEWISDLKLWVKEQAYIIPVQQSRFYTRTFTYKGLAKEVKIKGEFNGWNANQTILTLSN